MFSRKNLIYLCFLICVLILTQIIKSIDIENEGNSYFGLQLCSFFGIENLHKKWGAKRNIEFEFYPPNLHFDSIDIKIKNNSFTNFYTFSFPDNLPVLYTHDIICFESKCDTFIENPYGCGTGMFIRKVQENVLHDKLAFNIEEYLQTYLKDTFIPDSIILQKKMIMFELPWSIYRSQRIYSNKLVIRREYLTRIRQSIKNLK